MSALDHLKEYRVVQVALPRVDGESTVVDGVARLTDSPVFEITFLPDQLQPATFDEQAGCRITFTIENGSKQTLNAEVLTVVGDTKLMLRAMESFSQTQKRSYFRVDAALSVSYWPVDVDDISACSVQASVNISGGGIRIPVKKSMREGSKVGLEIILDVPRPCVIECVATVIRAFKLEGAMQLALNYIDIEEEDRDAIVAYCFAEQRKQLRLKVHMMGID